MAVIDDGLDEGRKAIGALGRTAYSAKLKVEQGELLKRRQDLCAQLGASLYELVKDNHELLSGREQIVSDITEVDIRRKQIAEKLSELEEEGRRARQAAVSYICPRCQTKLLAGDLFCTGCGLPVADIAAVGNSDLSNQGQPVCPKCGAYVVEGDRFCMKCGAALEPLAVEDRRATGGAEQPAISEPSVQPSPEE